MVVKRHTEQQKFDFPGGSLPVSSKFFLDLFRPARRRPVFRAADAAHHRRDELSEMFSPICLSKCLFASPPATNH